MSGPVGFQQRTADYADSRLWAAEAPAYRFLVADEVGLGKTLVAREIVRKTLERFPRSRVDVVYLCSSQAIASQNLRKLQIGGSGASAAATRLTLLALGGGTEAEGRVRYFAITPDTSFKIAGRTGQVRERALIFWCLKASLGPGGRALLQMVSDGRWEYEVSRVRDHPPDAAITERFVRRVTDDAALITDLRALAREALQRGQDGRWRARALMIGRLREHLAEASVDAVAQRGLVIVDEFQRFSDLLRPLGPEPTLAQRLAERLMRAGLPSRRVLLLSATPYRLPGVALTLGERPYDDFVGLVQFLAGDQPAKQLEAALTAYAGALRAPQRDTTVIQGARDTAQEILRAVMTRTERVAATAAADAMVQEDVRPLDLEPGEAAAAVAGRRVARRLKAHDTVEYWKSAPYFLDFMRTYRLRDAAVGSTGADRSWLGRQAAGRLLMDQTALRRMKKVTPPNARLRDLIAEALPAGTERLLWLNPSLPYMEPSGAFACARPDLKRLVFTEWRLAPAAISALVSYEVEQRLNADQQPKRPRRARRGIRDAARAHQRFAAQGELLRLGRPGGDDAAGQGLAALALLAPSAALAALGDPLDLALRTGRPVGRAEALDVVRKALEPKLRSLARPAGGGRADDRWYWAAPLLLEPDLARAWIAAPDPFGFEAEARGPEATRLLRAIKAVLQRPQDLGPRPRDLARVLAAQALAAPGVCALRALRRTMKADAAPVAARRAAFRIARGMQALFNQSEAAAAVALEQPRAKVYWRQALEYCMAGNLQALLDEQLHLVSEARAMFEGSLEKRLAAVAGTVHDSLTLRRGQIEVSGLERRRRGGGAGSVEAVGLRCRHAARFAEIKDADGGVSRLDAVRDAFNSPFRPFVLASTTVGQEGLDFHAWCHAVVHWNLPRSPVELEQREGRVHRYKGHAVRLNVAAGTGLPALAAAGASAREDPWAVMFRLASGREGADELAPHWLFEDCPAPVRVRRIVPHLKLSREAELWPRLRARLGIYRLVIGLPRQEDLMAALERNGVNAEDARTWRIDLSPRVASGTN